MSESILLSTDTTRRDRMVRACARWLYSNGFLDEGALITGTLPRDVWAALQDPESEPPQWDETDAADWWNDVLVPTMQACAPEGCVFMVHPDDATRVGYWPISWNDVRELADALRREWTACLPYVDAPEDPSALRRLQAVPRVCALARCVRSMFQDDSYAVDHVIPALAWISGAESADALPDMARAAAAQVGDKQLIEWLDAQHAVRLDYVNDALTLIEGSTSPGLLGVLQEARARYLTDLTACVVDWLNTPVLRSATSCREAERGTHGD